MTKQPSPHGRKVVIFGSTGTAGAGAVQACLQAPEISEVRAVTRRPLGFTHDKLVEVICSDFADLGDIAQQLRGIDTCLFCLGISASKVSGEDEYREIHVTYPLAAARTLLAESPAASFVYLSGSGTKASAWMMWARVKAEAEQELSELGLARHVNVRPGAIVPMQPAGLWRWVGRPLVQAATSLGIDAFDLGRAMLRIGLDPDLGAESLVLENRALRELRG